MVWEEKIYKKKKKMMKEKIKGKGNLPGPPRMGATGAAETSIVGGYSRSKCSRYG